MRPAPLIRYLVPPRRGRRRLDDFLAAASGLHPDRVRRAIEEGRAVLDGRPCTGPSRELEAGDAVDLLEPPEEARRPAPPREVELLHHDRWLAVMDKPAGVLSEPLEEPGGQEAADAPAADELLLLHLAWRTGSRPYLRLVHRLDRATSGALLFARRADAFHPLEEAWRGGEVDRLYLAVVEGDPPFDHEEVEAPVARERPGAWRFVVRGDGEPARTEIEVLERRGGTALVACRLRSGRTHQVRVHLAHLGLPVAGDRLYGASRTPARRPLLHAAEIVLPHPGSGEVLRVVSPTPEDLALPAAGSGGTA